MSDKRYVYKGYCNPFYGHLPWRQWGEIYMEPTTLGWSLLFQKQPQVDLLVKKWGMVAFIGLERSVSNSDAQTRAFYEFLDIGAIPINPKNAILPVKIRTSVLKKGTDAIVAHLFDTLRKQKGLGVTIWDHAAEQLKLF